MSARTRLLAAWLPLLSTGLAGCAALPPEVAAQALQGPGLAPRAPDPVLLNGLVDLVENKDRYKVDLSKIEGTPLGDALRLGSPVGYGLRNRHLNLGIPLAEALSLNPDPAFQDKLLTLAQWDRSSEVRAAAMVVLAGLGRDVGQLAIYQLALVHLDPGVRFGAIEALAIWGGRGAAPLLAAASEKDNEPILRVQAAAGLARLADPAGLVKLRAFLDNPSWLVKAMAGRYLGDFGTAADYDLLVGRIGRESSNDFVTAEYCIAALKLFAKRPA